MLQMKESSNYCHTSASRFAFMVSSTMFNLLIILFGTQGSFLLPLYMMLKSHAKKVSSDVCTNTHILSWNNISTKYNL